jgi:hypothetical protein
VAVRTAARAVEAMVAGTAVAMAVFALLHALKDSAPPPGDAMDPA